MREKKNKMKYESSAEVLVALESDKVVYKSDVKSDVFDRLVKIGAVATYKYEEDVEVVVLTDEFKKSMG